MSDQANDPGRNLPWLPAMQFASSSDQYAGVDRIYTERHSFPKAKQTAIPTFPSLTERSTRFAVGDVHPKYDYAYVIQAYISGQDDEMENWTVMYRVDLQEYAIAAGLGTSATWVNLLKKDGYRKSDEYGRDGSTVSWRFVVVNPDDYVAPALNTAHPTDTTAVLVAESIARDGIIGVVNRRYEKLAELSDFRFDEETGDLITTTRQIVATVAAPDPPGDTSRAEITQRALGTSFSLLVTDVIEGGGGSDKPTAYNYYHYIDVEFPRLLEDIAVWSDGGGSYRFEPQTRERYSRKVSMRAYVDFHFPHEIPAQSALFEMRPINWKYNGFSFSINEPGIITDEWDFFSIGGASFEAWTGRESTPTNYTEYAALIGEEVLINERITPWRFNLWRRERFYIVLE
jgi:hypothetical protein